MDKHLPKIAGECKSFLLPKSRVPVNSWLLFIVTSAPCTWMYLSNILASIAVSTALEMCNMILERENDQEQV